MKPRLICALFPGRQEAGGKGICGRPSSQAGQIKRGDRQLVKSLLPLLLYVAGLAGADGLMARCQAVDKAASPTTVDFGALRSPIIFQGDNKWAYRDPAAVYHYGAFYLYFTVSEMDGQYFYNRTAMSTSRDLLHWSTHGCASLGVAWTRDFKTWEWPGKRSPKPGAAMPEPH